MMTTLRFVQAYFVLNTWFSIVVLFSAWIFRGSIKDNSFNGVDTNSAKQFIKAQPFWKRLSMTYICKCNETGKQRRGIAIWYLICHHIQVLSYFIFLVISLQDLTSDFLFPERVVYGGMSILASGNLPVLAMGGIMLSLPIGIVPAIPYMIFSKKKLEERSEPLATASWERAFERIIKRAFPK